MKILYNVQVSNTTVDEEGNFKWLLRNDACFNIAMGISECLLNLDEDLEITLKLPRLEDVYDIEDYLELPLFKNNYNFHIYEDKIPISPVTSRFHFNMYQHSKHINFFKQFDCIINDENTLTKNWRTFFNMIVKKDIPIISTNYFLDSPIAKKVPEKIRYYERQMESFINSDIVAFQCTDSKREALEACSLLYNEDVIKMIEAKSSVWGVGVHAKEIKEYNTDISSKIPIIYFGNRITESVNRYTNWHIYSEAIGEISNYCDIPFEAWILNPTRKITDEQRKEIMEKSDYQMSMIENDTVFTRENYLEFINKADIGVSLFTTEVHGGVTHCEALLAENILISPKINNYKKKFEGWDYPFLCDYDKSNPNKIPVVASLVNKIVKALEIWQNDNNKFKYYQKMCKMIGYETESYEKASERIMDDIKKVTEGK